MSGLSSPSSGQGGFTGVVRAAMRKAVQLFGVAGGLLLGSLMVSLYMAEWPSYTIPSRDSKLDLLHSYARDLEYMLKQGTAIVDVIGHIDGHRDFPENGALVLYSPARARTHTSERFTLTDKKNLFIEKLSASADQPIVLEDHDLVAIGPVELGVPANKPPVQLMMFWRKPQPLCLQLHMVMDRFPALGVISLLGSLFFFLLLGVTLSPLRAVRKSFKDIGTGNLCTRLPSTMTLRPGEVGQLCRDFNYMVQSVEGMHDNWQGLLRDTSHELRAPLARMQLALTLAQNKTEGLAKSEFARLEKDLNYLDYLIEQMLVKSRASHSHGFGAKTWFAMDCVIDQLIDTTNFEAQASQRIVRLVETTPCQYFGDEDCLTRAVENLIRNAIRFSPQNGTVGVVLRKGEHGLVITVQDRGPGVPESALPHLFEPFFRVAEQHGGDRYGTGLGLTIVKSVVEGHGGTVMAVNTHPGLLVTMTLPWS